jgi:hypothetical protein
MEADIEIFEKIYGDAKGYHQRAKLFVNEKQPSSLIFNLSSVALECYLVALCELYGTMPRNHNFVSLMNAVERVTTVPREISKSIRTLDFIFGICPVDDYHHGVPEAADAERVLSLCSQVAGLFDQSLISSIKLASVVTNDKFN